MDIKETLKRLTSLYGVSGDERSISAELCELLGEYCDETSADAFGNVTGVLRAEGAQKTLLLDAHCDRVGLVVTYIDDGGFVRVGALGSPDLSALPARSVTIHGKEKLRGVVCTLPPHVSSDRKKAYEISDIAIDTGLTKQQAELLISPGDAVTADAAFRELAGGRVSAPAIDDRGGICVILAALDMLRDRRLRYNVAVSFSAQEETGERGAKMTAFTLSPDEAVAVDVSFGKTPDEDDAECAELSSGAMIGFSAALDREMSQALVDIAKRCNIPYTREIMPSSTGTNADAISVSGSGVKCCTVSFPIRYMHTPTEVVDISDMEAAARLIAEYIGGERDV